MGTGEAEGGRRSGKTTFELASEAAHLALADAGLQRDEIDAVFLEQPMSEHHHMPANVFLEYMDMRPQAAVAFAAGGATPHAMAIQAAGLIASGVYETILIVDADGRATRFAGDKGMATSQAADDMEEFETPYGASVPGRYALIAQRHMHDYGTTEEQLAQVAVVERKHASLNPRAAYRDPLTVREVLESPMVAAPFHLLECCMVSDWGTAFVMTSKRRAGRLNKPPVWIRGFGSAQQGYNLAPLQSFSSWPIQHSAKHAFRMAELTPEEVHVAELYDSFPITVLIALEELGFCEKGQGGAFVQGGAAELGGKIPVNTHGGQLSYACGHGQYILEAARQLRGEAGQAQADGARYGLSQGTAAICSSSYTIIYEAD
ncbi:thiolase family protein [Rubrobacter marinus]|uniref:Thiolase family protein n=1 Tax=Rubrobacter marinus TaxID=2653852 RepID=A0A6G8Q0G6_9ACTN|nr:thiolase family protein [Rubrobacter marinus]QIN79979.1 thiolase family protein [Rubrobacter marinus]